MGNSERSGREFACKSMGRGGQSPGPGPHSRPARTQAEASIRSAKARKR